MEQTKFVDAVGAQGDALSGRQPLGWHRLMTIECTAVAMPGCPETAFCSTSRPRLAGATVVVVGPMLMPLVNGQPLSTIINRILTRILTKSQLAPWYYNLYNSQAQQPNGCVLRHGR